MEVAVVPLVAAAVVLGDTEQMLKALPLVAVLPQKRPLLVF